MGKSDVTRIGKTSVAHQDANNNATPVVCHAEVDMFSGAGKKIVNNKKPTPTDAPICFDVEKSTGALLSKLVGMVVKRRNDANLRHDHTIFFLHPDIIKRNILFWSILSFQIIKCAHCYNSTLQSRKIN